MFKLGTSVVLASLLIAGAASADTYVTTKVVNTPGPGKVVVQKVVHTRPYRPIVVRPIVVRPFAVVKRCHVVVHVD